MSPPVGGTAAEFGKVARRLILRMERILSRYVALPALTLLAFAAFVDKGAGDFALGLLLLGFLAMLPVHGRAVGRDPLTWVMVIYLLWIPVAAAGLANLHPDSAAFIWDEAEDWAKTFILPVVVCAFWSARVPSLAPWLPLLLAVGFAAGVAGSTTPGLLADLISGRQRAEIGDVATHFGFYSLLALLAAVISIGTIRGVKRRWLRLSLHMLVAAAALIALLGLLFSQTRSAWLAGLIAGLACGAVYLHLLWPARHRRTETYVGLGAAAVLIVVVGLLFHDLLLTRILHVSDTVAQLLSWNWSDLPNDSVGLRIRAYRAGISVWLERPLFGHGPGIDRISTQYSGEGILTTISHFHMIYLNVLATFGLVGFALFAFVFGVLWRRTVLAVRNGSLSIHCVVFLLGAAIALAVFGLFDEVLTSHSMSSLFAVVGAIIGSANRIRCDGVPEHSDDAEAESGSAPVGDAPATQGP